MIEQDFDIFSGERIDPPKIVWEEGDRYAIIAFLLLSIDKEMGDEDVKKLSGFMGIAETQTEGDANDGLTETGKARDMIIRKGNAFLENLDADEDRYDSVMDELDRVIGGNDKCGIGDGYATLGKTVKYKNLDGAAYWLFDYLKLAVFDESYGGNKKRFLKHLARKWDIDKSVLSMLESSAKWLDETSQKRVEIRDSDMPHREAVAILAELDAGEKTVWKELNKLHIAKDRSVSAYVTGRNRMIDGMEALTGVRPFECGIRDEDDPAEEEDDYEEESFSDKIGDGIVEGIHKVADLICAPFDWMTDKIMARTLK